MSKKKSIFLSIGIFISWWIIIYISMNLGANINLKLNNIGGEGEHFVFYYYLSALFITLLIYILLLPFFIKKEKKKYFNMLKLKINKTSLTYIIIPIFCSILGYIIFGNVYKLNTLNYISSIQPPIVEELLFRGLILSILTLSFSKKSSIIISSILFGLIHIFISPINAIGAIFIGVIYCLIVFRTKSILPTIFIHYIQSTNLYQFILCIIGISIFETICFFKRKIKQNKELY